MVIKMTPMQALKDNFKILKSLSYLNYLELNGKNRKNTFVSNQMYVSNAVLFDYFILFNLLNSGTYRNSKNDIRYNSNFGFAINYKEKIEIRATVKVSHDSGVEYSKAYSISEVKELFNLFIKNVQEKDILKRFIEIFDIKLSNKLNQSEIASIFREENKKFNELENKIKIIEFKIKELVSLILKNKKTMIDSSKEKEKLSLLNIEKENLYKEKKYFLTNGSKEIPFTVRKRIVKQ